MTPRRDAGVYCAAVMWMLSVACAALIAGLTVYLWLRRPPAPMWPAVILCHVAGLLWVTGDVWATHASSLHEKQLALLVLFSGSLTLPALWWATVRRYTLWNGLGGAWLKRSWWRLPAAFAAATWLMMITNPWHESFLRPVLGARNEYGFGIRIALYGNYAIGFSAALLCAWAARRHSSPGVRRRMGLLAVAGVAPAFGNLYHHFAPASALEDETSIGLLVSSLVLVYGVLRERLFNPLPVAVAEILRRDPAGQLLLDRGGRLLMWNPAADRLLRGIALRPDLRVLRELAWQLTDESGQRLRSSRELSNRLSDGARAAVPQIFRYGAGSAPCWLELSVTPIATRRGQLSAVCLRIEDVSIREQARRERAALRARMQNAQKLESLGLLAGGIAHDFNNLLTAITGNAALARDALDEGDPVRESLDEVLEAADLAADLTRQLLAYAGRSLAISEAVSLSEVAAEMLRRLAAHIPSGIVVHTSFESDLPAIEGDATQIRQVLVNLFINAVQAVGSTGFVSVRTECRDLSPVELARDALADRLQPGRHVLLEVSDSGAGMDAETRERIFDPFFSTRDDGRGLGLAAVFGIVRSHDGAIHVESEPGRGTSVRVWLPASPLVPRSVPRAALRADAPEARESGMVLVAEDEARLRRLCERVLGDAGFSVVCAADGEEAFALFREHRERIRLVILDLSMPGPSGAEALARILEIDPDARVLLTSGFSEADTGARLALERLRGFLPKPYRPSALLRAVRKALA